ncbi:MAG: acyl-phosphate glycerol 3-phosphate acyltransferase [Burkholderiaceae bacterium]|nr:acyl-phosphate glycerol 3-phosphate acyltransferase [Burkholderiaceae bacterium]
MLIFRLVRMVMHVITGLLTCALIFPHLNAAKRNERIWRWSAKLLEMCRVRVKVQGELVQNALVVSNHVSWLDIYVINSQQPCRFVAKDSIRSWPVVGWLCEQAGTVFLQRGNARDLRRIFHNLVENMQAGGRFAFFPEGTTSNQGTLLPFHPNLFEAAIDAGVPVQPYALRYLDAAGRPHPTIGFVGEISLLESILAIAGGSEIIVELQMLPVLPTEGARRRELAFESRQAIANALGLDVGVADSQPETERGLQAAPR